MCFIGLSSLDFASAIPLSETAIYYRCHSQLTRTRPTAEDSKLKKIREGEIAATQACIDLINEASLDKTGALVNQNKDTNQLALKILRNLQSVHSSWFPLKDFIQDEVDAVTFHLFDSNEMAYHLTYNLLAPNAKASELLTRTTSFKGVRATQHKPVYFVDLASPTQIQEYDKAVWRLGESEVEAEQKIINPKLVQFGQLVGLAPLKNNENTVEYVKKDKTSLTFDLTSSLGGGILGNRSYILLNTNQKPNEHSDGGLHSHRSWAKSVFQDLLCRSLPVVRSEDVINYFPEAKLSFRKSKTCMQCHVSMDPMADTIRNVYEVRSKPKLGEGFSVRILAEEKTRLSSETTVQDADPDFHLRPAKGELYFRNYKDELVSEKVDSLQGLGEAIARTDDFYICMAKKYFQFFTGVSVDVQLKNNSENLSQDKHLQSHKDFVIQLGLDLKKEQNLKNILRKIMDSPFYKDSSYGVVK